MVQCCFTSTETIRLIRTGSPGRPPRLSHTAPELCGDVLGRRLKRMYETVPTVVDNGDNADNDDDVMVFVMVIY